MMPLFLKSGAEIVAELGPEFLSSANTRTWPLRPTPEFEHVRPDIAAMNAMQHEPMAIPAAITSIPDERERALAIQSWIRTDPRAQRRTSVFERYRGLELLITDAMGVPLPNCTLMGVVEVPPASVPVSPEMRADLEERGFRGGPPYYMATALLTPQR